MNFKKIFYYFDSDLKELKTKKKIQDFFHKIKENYRDLPGTYFIKAETNETAVEECLESKGREFFYCLKSTDPKPEKGNSLLTIDFTDPHFDVKGARQMNADIGKIIINDFLIDSYIKTQYKIADIIEEFHLKSIFWFLDSKLNASKEQKVAFLNKLFYRDKELLDIRKSFVQNYEALEVQVNDQGELTQLPYNEEDQELFAAFCLVAS